MVSAEFQEHFGEHAYDAEGNYIGAATDDVAADEDEAWAQYYSETEETATAAPDVEIEDGDDGGADVSAAVEVDAPAEGEVEEASAPLS